MSVDLERLHWSFSYMFCLAQDTSPADAPPAEESYAALLAAIEGIVSWHLFLELVTNFIVGLARFDWFLNGTLHWFVYYMFCLAHRSLHNMTKLQNLKKEKFHRMFLGSCILSS